MRRGGPNLLRLISIVLLLAAVSLFFYELVAFSRQRARLPLGLTIAGVPVGGLDQTEALERILQTYSTPVEVHYGDQIILLSPASVGFSLDTEVMLAAAELKRTGTDFWGDFWNYLWNRPGQEDSIPLRAEYSREQLQAALVDISHRYDRPSIPARPIPGRAEFTAGEPGRELDVARGTELVGQILMTPADRHVRLPILRTVPSKPALNTLETLLKQIIDVSGFDGLAVLYMVELNTRDELHFAHFRNQEAELQPDVAFDAGSVIKIAIAITYYRYFDEPLDAEAERLMDQMITESANDPADWLMERFEKDTGPLFVTETLRELGYANTFISAYFHPGAKALAYIETDSNLRKDINTRPNIFNQTTASEIGTLLVDLYSCSRGGGALLAVFPDEIRPEECRKVLDLLGENKIGVLIEAGVPEGTTVAHKHGWTSSPLDFVGDAGIVFTPNGDYALVLFLWNDPEMIWDPTSRLFAEVSRAVYNYVNPPLGGATGGGS